jgi:hypothetical protein
MSNPNRNLTPEQRAEARRQGFPLGTDSYRNLIADATVTATTGKGRKVHLPTGDYHRMPTMGEAHGATARELDKAATAFLRRKGVKSAHDRDWTGRDKRAVVGPTPSMEAVDAVPGTTLMRGGNGGTARHALMAQGR